MEKEAFTHLLHWFIRQEKTCDLLCHLLKNRRKSVEAFMGVINNTYRPIEGTIKLIMGIPCFPREHDPNTPATSSHNTQRA
jgi:hypothetical protein